jgi:single-strand DNA-binding protein
MLNQTVIIGRIVKDPEITQTDNGKKVTNLNLAVPRSYKNVDGDYETDYIPCVLWQGIAENVVTYCKKGDLVGVKGRLETSSYEKDESVHYVMQLIAEKVTFLSSKSDTKEEKKEKEEN